MRLSDTLSMLQGIRDSGHAEIIVSYSGGKDSLATLDLCSRVFERVHAYFLYWCKGLETEERLLRMAEKRWNCTVTRLPSPAIQTYLSGSYGKRVAQRRRYKLEDTWAIMRDRTGVEWIAFGQRMDESIERAGMLKESKGVMDDARRVYPLWDWKAKDVFAYLRNRRIPIPTNFGSEDTGGCGLDPQTLLWLRENEPGDYAKVLEAFPRAAALIERERVRLKQGEKLLFGSIKRAGLMDALTGNDSKGE